MRVTKIEIKNFFGYLNHTIDLREKGLTILYGLNSSGKTTILKLLNEIFQGNTNFRNFFFDEVKICFSNLKYLQIKKNHINIDFFSKKPFFEYGFSSNYKDAKSFSRGPYYRSKSSGMLVDLVNIRQKLNIVEIVKDFDFDIKRETGGYSEEEKRQNHEKFVLEAEEFVGNLKSIKETNLKWYIKLITRIRTYFIQTKRLIVFDHVFELFDLEPEEFQEEPYMDIVHLSSIEILEKIEEFRKEGIKKHQTFVATFHDGLKEHLKQQEAKTITERQLKNKITNVLIKSNTLVSYGLIDESIADYFDEIIRQELNDENFRRIYFEIEKVEKALKLYEKLGGRIFLFLELLNRRYTNKMVRIFPVYGLTIFTKHAFTTTQVRHLSSGEKQLFIIFYELIFKTFPKSLILIDEPELSLHVSWQEEFINDLIKIQKLTKFVFIIATHSPQIISSHWNLTVELEVPDD